MKTLFVILLVLSFGFIHSVTAQKITKEKKATQIEKTFQELRQIVESNHFKITITHVYPQSGHDVSRFNPRGEITINDSIAKGQLPFFGRAYSLPYGDAGIEFDAPMKKQSTKIVEKKKKKHISYQFTVPAKNDIYQFYIEMSPEGNCSISLTSNNRAHISYTGTVSPTEMKEN